MEKRSNWVGAIAASRDGSLFYIGMDDGIVRAVDSTTFKLVRCYFRPGSQIAEPLGSSGANAVFSIAESPDGRRVIVARKATGGETVDVFDQATSAVLISAAYKQHCVPGYRDESIYFQTVEVTPDNGVFPIMRCTAGGQPSIFRAFRMDSDLAKASIDVATTFHVTPTKLVTFSGAGIRLYDLANPMNATGFIFSPPYVRWPNNSIAFDQAGRYCTIDKAGKLFYSETVEKEPREIGSATTIEPGTKFYSGICGFTDATHAYTVATLGKDTGRGLSMIPRTFRLWDLAIGKVEVEIKPESGFAAISGVAVSPKGYLAMGSFGSIEKPGLIDIVRLNDQKHLARLSSPFATSPENVVVEVIKLER